VCDLCTFNSLFPFSWLANRLDTAVSPSFSLSLSQLPELVATNYDPSTQCASATVPYAVRQT